MSHIWTFSPSSQVMLQRCLEAAEPPDPCNKWIQLFGSKNKKLSDKNNTIIVLSDSPDIENKIATDIKENSKVLTTFDEIYDSDFSVVGKIDFLQESLKDPKLLTSIAEKCPMNTIDGILHHVFEKKDLENDSLQLFFEYFLPVLIKRDNSRLSTDILLKTYELYPQYFIILLKKIIKDLDINNNVLNNFVSMLDGINQTEFLNYVMYIELTPNEFVHNLFTIYTAYKTCNKTDNIQKYIFNCLSSYSNVCIDNKHYGRLMLSYLQNEKNTRSNANIVKLEELLEMHKSPFKRPCLSVLKEIKEN